MRLAQPALDFLRDLSRNNNRDWFQQNKARYERDLKKPFESFVGELIRRFQEIDPAIAMKPKDAIFRINRDTRFSKDKRPYKENVGAVISTGARASEIPGFYLHLEGGMLMMGGGAYFLEPATLLRVRRFIQLHPRRFSELLTAPAFVEKYEALQGEENKRLPPEFVEFAREQPLVAKKQFYYMAELPPETILEEDIFELVTDYYLGGKPLNDFFAEAIQG